MEITDDGRGISSREVQKIRQDMAGMKKKLEENDTNIEMEFGGKAELSVQALDRGTKVVITAPFDKEETGSRNAL